MELPTDAIFSDFTIHHTTYPISSGIPIPVSVLIPKGIRAGTHPFSVNIHGGYLVTGHKTYAPWFHWWLPSISTRRQSVIVSPDYRLLPTAHGLKDISSDLQDFWAWTHNGSLSAYVASQAPGVELDFARVMLLGSSAGGYGAAQIALSDPDRVRVLALFYPMVNLQTRFWREGPAAVGKGTPMGAPLESLMSREELEAWAEGRLASGEVVTSGEMDEFMYGAAALARGFFWNLFDPRGEVGTDDLPMERVRRGDKLPGAVWMVHGAADTAVPVEDTLAFEGVVKEVLPETDIRVDVAEGQEHGVDNRWEGYAEWAKESQAWFEKAWFGE